MTDPDYLEHLDSLDLTDLLVLENKYPDDVDLLIRIGGTYLKSYQFDKCRDYYVRALMLDPYNGWSHLNFGSLCYALKCYSEAIRHFQYAADFLPGVACPHWCLGDAYRARGDYPRAHWHYHKSVEMDTTDLKARQKLKDWLAENENTE